MLTKNSSLTLLTLGLESKLEMTRILKVLLLENGLFALLLQKSLIKNNHILLVIYGVLGVFFSLWLRKKLHGILIPEKEISRKPQPILMLKKVWFMDALMTISRRLTGFQVLLMDAPSTLQRTDGQQKESSKRLKF
jgi:hypothetical protein